MMVQMPLTRTNEDAVDLALAAAVQSALLPESCPSDCPHQKVAARNRMCSWVGGDFYNFVRLNEDQMAVLIGDVIGHGVRASLIMAEIMGFLRSHPARLSRPGEMIADLNHLLIELGDRAGTVVPCSMFYGVLDAPTGMGFFVNAGHPHPFLCDARRCEVLSLRQHNLLLGIEGFQPTEICMTFRPGQRLVLHTDGLADAVNEQGERFGQRRLHVALSDHAGGSPADCADAVFAAVDAFRGAAPQADDETIVVMDRV
jgi:sigma-B regulation protein RsbU (phosphoserine phosphatase)